MKIFAIGDTAWWPHVGREPITAICSICFGQRKVTLILGNKEHVLLDCDYCGKGYKGPQGVETIYEFISRPEKVIITGIDIKESEQGIERTYYSGCHYFRELYETMEEAAAVCVTIKEKQELEESTRAEYIKANCKKNFAWNAGYHRRCAKKAREDAEYHERKAALCSARAKTGEESK